MALCSEGVNLCFQTENSCSVCCGIQNLNLTHHLKKKWLKDNTGKFFKLDKTRREDILKFRREGEEYLERHKIRQDSYVCPFVGMASDTKTGCLLLAQKKAVPETVVGQDSLRNCSFYGESICSQYNCFGKTYLEKSSFKELLIQVKNLDSLTYGKLVSNHNLIQVCQKIISRRPDMAKPLLYEVIEKLSAVEIPVTSFEMPLNLDVYPDDLSWSILGTLFDNAGYIFEGFVITREGIETGHVLKEKLGSRL